MSGSESGGGQLVALPESLLGPLRQLAALVERFGSLPRAIFALISLYLLNGVLEIFGVIAGAVLFVFDVIVGSISTAQQLLLGAFSAVGIDILGTLVALQTEIASVVASAGPAGPVIAVGGTALVLYVAWEFGSRLVIGLIGELPGGSTLLELFGVD